MNFVLGKRERERGESIDSSREEDVLRIMDYAGRIQTIMEKDQSQRTQIPGYPNNPNER